MVSLEGVKWLLVALMVLDHVAVAWHLPQEYRYPARLVFPGFAALIAYHLARGTPPQKYLSRLLPFAFLAQAGYSLLFHMPGIPLNVLFTFAGAALLFRGSGWGYLSLLSEYPLGGLGIAWAAKGQPFLGALCVGASAHLFGWPVWVSLGQALAFLGFFRLFPHLKHGKRTPWWSFYAFYAGHLYLLYLLKLWWPL